MDLSGALRPITALDRALSTFLDFPSTFEDFDRTRASAPPALQPPVTVRALPRTSRAEIVNETIVGLLQAVPGAFNPQRAIRIRRFRARGHVCRAARARAVRAAGQQPACPSGPRRSRTREETQTTVHGSGCT